MPAHPTCMKFGCLEHVVMYLIMYILIALSICFISLFSSHCLKPKKAKIFCLTTFQPCFIIAYLIVQDGVF